VDSGLLNVVFDTVEKCALVYDEWRQVFEKLRQCGDWLCNFSELPVTRSKIGLEELLVNQLTPRLDVARVEWAHGLGQSERDTYRGFDIFIYGVQGVCALERSHPGSDEEILILYRMSL
jgi:hypothetical protein